MALRSNKNNLDHSKQIQSRKFFYNVWRIRIVVFNWNKPNKMVWKVIWRSFQIESIFSKRFLDSCSVFQYSDIFICNMPMFWNILIFSLIRGTGTFHSPAPPLFLYCITSFKFHRAFYWPKKSLAMCIYVKIPKSCQIDPP